jgi:hypothetical protein
VIVDPILRKDLLIRKLDLLIGMTAVNIVLTAANFAMI